MANPTDIVVIGGGIVGAACASELAERGARVTLIDKSEPGHGCSYGNAGWITPCFAVPLPMPGMFWKSMKWLLDPESPLHIKPRASWELARWLLRFTRSMNSRALHDSTRALVALAKHSLDAYARMDAEQPGSFGFQKRGLLIAAQTPAGVEAAVAEMKLVEQYGVPGRPLTAAQAKELEPALTGNIAGGVYFPEEAHAEPLAAVKALVARAERFGATILPNTEVIAFERHGRRIESIRTTRGPLRADQFVLATGSWSTNLAKSLDLRVPILAGKGYAVIVEPFEPAPKIPLMLLEKKVAATPRDGSIRLAGTLELVDSNDHSVSVRRVDALLRGAREMVSVPREPKILEVWRGLRPCTPDGVPIIGRPAACDNLVIAAGLQTHVVLTPPHTPYLATAFIREAQPTSDLAPSRATRF